MSEHNRVSDAQTGVREGGGIVFILSVLAGQDDSRFGRSGAGEEAHFP
jgi:hypothetical protein